MKPAMSVLAICTLLAFGQGFAVAQQMPPKTDMMMMHAQTVEGVVTRVRFVNCGATPQTCQGIFEITPSAKGEVMKGDAMMQKPEAGKMMMEHPLTVIVVPGTALIWQNGPIPLTRLHAGDLVKVDYQELSNMNVVTNLTMTGMGHM
jgi:hypothetical protein